MSAAPMSHKFPQADSLVTNNSKSRTRSAEGKAIWIDLENSPHVPFFKPIIEELEKRGHTVMLTARDCFQVCELADLFQLSYKRIGHHYGKNIVAKFAGLGVRVLQMAPTVLRKRPDLALSHGSRSLFVLSTLLQIPTITIFDYEYAKWPVFARPAWVMVPEIIPEQGIVDRGMSRDRILKYPGIKEDVYVPFFQPDPATREKLGLQVGDLVVTVRPPATEAHYHNPESEILLDGVFEFVAQLENARIVLLPRTNKQETELRKRWPALFADRKAIVPEHVVDGLDLIWHSDLVISGGGTMNREAAALDVPVYSIFRGKIGAVDEYLAKSGRLVLLKSLEDVRTRISFKKRDYQTNAVKAKQSHITLNAVVDNIIRVLGES